MGFFRPVSAICEHISGYGSEGGSEAIEASLYPKLMTQAAPRPPAPACGGECEVWADCRAVKRWRHPRSLDQRSRLAPVRPSWLSIVQIAPSFKRKDEASRA